MTYIRGREKLFLMCLAALVLSGICKLAQYTHILADAAVRVVLPEQRFVEPGHVRVVGQGRAIHQALMEEISATRPGDIVRIAMFRWSDPDLARVCIERHRQGVDIALIVDAQAPTQKGSQIRKLRKAGIGVAVLPLLAGSDERPPLMHHKFVVIQSADRAVAITGSYNFTIHAREKNHENMIFIHDAAVSKDYKTLWDRLARQSRYLAPEQT